MKLRIKGNSLRLRLTKTEVEQLTSKGCVEERTTFSKSVQLIYKLQTTGDDSMFAAFNDNTIAVFIPSSFVKDWSLNDIITLSGNTQMENNETLSIIVEKDFKCIDETGEDQSDNYENPNKAC